MRFKRFQCVLVMFAQWITMRYIRLLPKFKATKWKTWKHNESNNIAGDVKITLLYNIQAATMELTNDAFSTENVMEIMNSFTYSKFG